MSLRRLSVGDRRTLVRHVFFPILLLCALFTYTLLLFQRSLAVTGCDAGQPTATLVFTGVLETNSTVVRLPELIYNRNSIRKLLLNSLEDRRNRSFQGTTDLPKLRRDLTWAKRLPQALIIGVKKGGTRALLEFLRLHPDVRAPGPEVHFFDRFYDNGLEWYRRQMPSSLEGQLTIEKTPSYFITPEVPSRVHKLSPAIKLIVVVRDPVTRAVSDYTQAVSKHPETKTFEEMAYLNWTTGLLDTSWSAIRIGVYAKHLEKWLQFFPVHQIHFVSGEQLISDPVGEMAKVQNFLGLENVITDKHFYFNETKGFPCLKKSEGNGNPHCLGKTKGRLHPKIQTETIHRLRDFYRPFNLKFYHMVGQSFGWG